MDSIDNRSLKGQINAKNPTFKKRRNKELAAIFRSNPEYKSLERSRQVVRRANRTEEKKTERRLQKKDWAKRNRKKLKSGSGPSSVVVPPVTSSASNSQLRTPSLVTTGTFGDSNYEKNVLYKIRIT